MELDAPRFRAWVERAMERVGIHNRAELARRLGVSDVAVYRWMDGTNRPSFDNLAALAQVLEVSRYEMYRELGLLPDVPDADMQEISELWERASPRERELLTAMAREVLRHRLPAEPEGEAQ